MQNLNILRVTAGSGINQIRGINRSGATGAGIPQHVTNVSTSMANASAGSTSTVSVTFRRDPSDVNFNGVTVWVKGYQGNQTPTQVASGTDSPINFILNNTGEALSVTVQANGNGGSAPITTAPTAGLTLPRSASGAGTTTTTSAVTLQTNSVNNTSQTKLNLKNGSNITITADGAGGDTITATIPPFITGSPSVGQLAKFASPATTVTGGDLTGDVTTAGATAVTVVKVQGTNFNSGTPFDQQVWKYLKSGTNWAPVINAGPSLSLQCDAVSSGVPRQQGLCQGWTMNTTTVPAVVVSTATVPPGLQFTSSAGAGNSAGFILTGGGVHFQFFREVNFQFKLGQTANMRIWVGLCDLGTNTPATLRSDTPAVNFVGLRYSTFAGDTKYQCVTQTAAANSTKTAESTASHVDTGVHSLTIRWDDTNAIFLIDGVQVGSQSTNIPTTGVQPIFLIDNGAVAVANIATFYNSFGVCKTV